jgi:hypothetical protein
MPWIRLKKSHTLATGKKLPIGQVFKVDRYYADELIRAGGAEVYEGPLPPSKMRTDMFRPKHRGVE